MGEQRESKGRHGFTLIELLVVVALFSVISAFVIPKLLEYLDRGNQSESTRDASEAALPDDAAAPSETAAIRPPAAALDTRRQGALPTVQAATFDIELLPAPPRAGLQIANRFRAGIRGSLTLTASDLEADDALRLAVPFPHGTTDIVEFQLTLQGAGRDGTPDAEELELTDGGFTWTGLLEEAATEQSPLTARFSYVAEGVDRFALHFPTARQLREVNVTLRAPDLDDLTVAATSLAPTERATERLRWTYDNLVSRRAIEIRVSGAANPLRRALDLFRLAGLAVLLFGAGFRYLGQLYRPGRLDSFRWGHFLLLAATYSFFFVVLGVLAHRGWGAAVALGTSALLSLPLLAFHVATIFDRRFAWTRAMPLAIWTITVVATGVYGDSSRTLLYVASAFVGIAVVTLTYPKLHRRAESELEDQVELLSSRIAGVTEQANTVRELGEAADEQLRAEDAACLDRLRTRVDEARMAASEVLDREAMLRDEQESIPQQPSRGARLRLAKSVLRRADQLSHSLESAASDLRATLEHLDQGRARARQRALEEKTDAVHCSACGAHVGGSRFCSACGTEAPQRSQCRSCGHELRVPRTLLAKGVDLKSLHCMACGEPPKIVATAPA